jgi:hypothetical protein
MEEKYIPKVGDLVKITKSERNWNNMMDKYVGEIFKIEDILLNNDGKQRSIKFKDSNVNGTGRHSWIYEHGHFEPYIPKKIKIKINFPWKNQK